MLAPALETPIFCWTTGAKVFEQSLGVLRAVEVRQLVVLILACPGSVRRDDGREDTESGYSTVYVYMCGVCVRRFEL